ncbi:hypothetical protein ACPF8X_00185 [Streptomyces sp. G35A]
MKRIAGVGIAAAVIVISGSAGSASAATGVCIDDRAALFYNSNLGGAFHCFMESGVSDYAGYKFDYAQGGTGGENGFLQPLKNNAASVDNTLNSRAYRVYYNSNYAGVYQTIGSHSWANLNSSLKNENASGRNI